MRYLLIVAMLMVAGTGWAGAMHTVDNLCVEYSTDSYGRIKVFMSNYPDNENAICELIVAAEGVLPYLSSPSHQEWPMGGTDYSVIRPYPSELELAEAEAKMKSDHVQWLKDKDSAIKRFRDALKKVKEG